VEDSADESDEMSAEYYNKRHKTIPSTKNDEELFYKIIGE